MANKTIVVIIALFFISAGAIAAQPVETTATVVCGRSEQTTPCVLILNRHVPSYDLSVKNGNANVINFKVERVKDMWEVLGQSKKDRLIEVIIDIKDGSYVVRNPRLPYVDKDLIPEGHDGLVIKTVEVK